MGFSIFKPMGESVWRRCVQCVSLLSLMFMACWLLGVLLMNSGTDMYISFIPLWFLELISLCLQNVLIIYLWFYCTSVPRIVSGRPCRWYNKLDSAWDIFHCGVHLSGVCAFDTACFVYKRALSTCRVITKLKPSLSYLHKSFFVVCDFVISLFYIQIGEWCTMFWCTTHICDCWFSKVSNVFLFKFDTNWSWFIFLLFGCSLTLSSLR